MEKNSIFLSMAVLCRRTVLSSSGNSPLIQYLLSFRVMYMYKVYVIQSTWHNYYVPLHIVTSNPKNLPFSMQVGPYREVYHVLVAIKLDFGPPADKDFSLSAGWRKSSDIVLPILGLAQAYMYNEPSLTIRA